MSTNYGPPPPVSPGYESSASSVFTISNGRDSRLPSNATSFTSRTPSHVSRDHLTDPSSQYTSREPSIASYKPSTANPSYDSRQEQHSDNPPSYQSVTTKTPGRKQWQPGSTTSVNDSKKVSGSTISVNEKNSWKPQQGSTESEKKSWKPQQGSTESEKKSWKPQQGSTKSIGESESNDSGDENEERGNWGNKIDFLLSCVGYAVGLGNVWRFPYLCYKNGGGAFLVPYTIMLFAAGLPMFVLELGFGQYVSKGCIGVWDIAPLFRGLGYAMVVVSGLVVIYYNMVVAYTIFYFFASFNKVVPWASCDNYWNTANCTISTSNSTNVTDFVNGTATRPAQEFWENYALGLSSGLEDMGPIRWQLFLSLLAAWIVVFLCICKGVKSSGKVVYFTATFPYVVLFILFIRGVTLPGAGAGIYFYIVPDFSKIGNATVWKDAAVQIFYSLGPAWGGLHTLASYNKFHNNFQRDGVIVALINCGTSVFAGFVIFSVIGFMSHDSGIPIEDVAAGGSGLAFVAYPEAIARMPGSVFWALIFFFMLFTLGLDSMFVTLETVVTAVVDELKPMYPNIYQKKTHITAAASVVFFILGWPMTCNGGFYLLTLMDEYSAGFSLLVVAMTEAIVISYVYDIRGFMNDKVWAKLGVNRYVDDMAVMLGFQMNMYWKVCWMAISPLIIFFVFVFFCATYSGLTLDGYVYPGWANFLGWGMVIVALIPIPVYMFYFLKYQAEGDTWTERFHFSLQPADTWGPALNKHREEANYPLIYDGKPQKATSSGNGSIRKKQPAKPVKKQWKPTWQPPPKKATTSNGGTLNPGYNANGDMNGNGANNGLNGSGNGYASNGLNGSPNGNSPNGYSNHGYNNSRNDSVNFGGNNSAQWSKKETQYSTVTWI